MRLLRLVQVEENEVKGELIYKLVEEGGKRVNYTARELCRLVKNNEIDVINMVIENDDIKSIFTEQVSYGSEESLENINENLANEWHRDLNGFDKSAVFKRNPDGINAYTDMCAVWKCSVCGYIWSAPISERVAGRRGCPWCAERKEKRINI